MKRENQTVWTSESGSDLLIWKANGEFYTPVGTMSKATLIELSQALNDAVKLVTAIEKDVK